MFVMTEIAFKFPVVEPDLTQKALDLGNQHQITDQQDE